MSVGVSPTIVVPKHVAVYFEHDRSYHVVSESRGRLRRVRKIPKGGGALANPAVAMV
jgi:hypothetical protein